MFRAKTAHSFTSKLCMIPLCCLSSTRRIHNLHLRQAPDQPRAPCYLHNSCKQSHLIQVWILHCSSLKPSCLRVDLWDPSSYTYLQKPSWSIAPFVLPLILQIGVATLVLIGSLIKFLKQMMKTNLRINTLVTNLFRFLFILLEFCLYFTLALFSFLFLNPYSLPFLHISFSLSPCTVDVHIAPWFNIIELY